MGKTQKSISVPRDKYAEFEALFKEHRDVCEQLEISSAAAVLRVCANLGREPFLEMVEQVRKWGTISDRPP